MTSRSNVTNSRSYPEILKTARLEVMTEVLIKGLVLLLQTYTRANKISSFVRSLQSLLDWEWWSPEVEEILTRIEAEGKALIERWDDLLRESGDPITPCPIQLNDIRLIDRVAERAREFYYRPSESDGDE